MQLSNEQRAVLFGLGAVLLWSTVATAFKLSLQYLAPVQLLAWASLVIHRIGRTGRNGATGEALSLVSPDEAQLLRQIQRILKDDIRMETVSGFEPSRPIRMGSDAAGARRPEAASRRWPRAGRAPRQSRLTQLHTMDERRAGIAGPFFLRHRNHRDACEASPQADDSALQCLLRWI